MKAMYDPPPSDPQTDIKGLGVNSSASDAIAAPTVSKIPNWWKHDDRWWNAKEGDLYTTPWFVRYPLGTPVAYGAWWTFAEWDTKKVLARWMIGGALVIISLGLMRELILGVVVAALAGLALWAAGAAVAALPISVAIVVGALIIAAAVKKE